LENTDKIQKTFNDVDNGEVKYIKETLKRDTCADQKEALVEIYRRLRPGDLVTPDTAQDLIFNMFFNFDRYDLSKVGRWKTWQRLPQFREMQAKKPARHDAAASGGERPVLIHDIQRDSVSDKFIHIDFYQASLKQEVEVVIPLVFKGVAPVIKELGGTLVKEIQEIKIKALPQNLPHDIKIDVTSLKTFEDEIFIKDLKIPAEVKVLRNPDEIIVKVVPPTKVEEELEKPIEEKVEEVEKVEKEKKVEEVVEEEQPVKPANPKAPEKK